MTDTTVYLLAGLAVVIGGLGLYTVLLRLRFRAARKNRRLLEQLEDDEYESGH